MSTFVAYSLVPTNGVNTVITGNYASAGSRGPGDIGIELAGTGAIAGTYIEGFRYGAIVYGAGFNVRTNSFIGTTEAVTLAYAKTGGRIVHARTPEPDLPPHERTRRPRKRAPARRRPRGR